ncbi:RES family NAD+ phosphorylase [Gardnerella sp. KA00747]|uniref:RES family NAD+ phosphorylase n=1 Tax=Gardnerella sp. KA00747 TaxID=2749078 RepID=UPI003BA8ADA2
MDYIPTQYISDYIKSKGYDGIEYVSVMSDAGKNLAIFNPEILKITLKLFVTRENLKES